MRHFPSIPFHQSYAKVLCGGMDSRVKPENNGRIEGLGLLDYRLEFCGEVQGWGGVVWGDLEFAAGEGGQGLD